MKKSRVNSEIKSLIAQKNSLKQDLHLSELQYKRYKNLYKNHTISKEKFDQVETMYNKLIYQIKSITHKINSLQAIYKELDEKIKNAHIGISIAKKNESKILSAIESLNSLKKREGLFKGSFK